MSRLSLRARLVLGVLLVAIVGLLVADAATYAALRSTLFDRVDSSLNDRHVDGERYAVQNCDGGLDFGGPGFGGPRGRGGGPPGGSSLAFVQVRKTDGKTVVCTPPVQQFGDEAAAPKLPETIEAPPTSSATGVGDQAHYFTTRATTGDERFRVRASYEPELGAMLVVASSLSDVDSTLSHLRQIEVFVTIAVLLAIVLFGLWIVTLGLRPLTAIGRTAAQITGGDLSRRVERAEPRTEIGRLGLALNTMLDRIEASDRRLRRFVADASHELRTPLAAVSAYAELFHRGADKRPDDLARAMSGITRESDRMKELVEDLLLLARLDEGQPLEHEPVELSELAAEAVETARAVDPSRPLDLQAEPATVLGDRARLRRVLDNLLGNVRSHTPPMTPAHVRVTTLNGSAVLEVSDEGPGLADEDLARVFERFYRADTSRSRESGGVGLGLSIVAAIADAHHGRVSVAPGPEGGATFRVELPLAR
jgi:two-component system, OmpR family, sensor kinase